MQLTQINLYPVKSLGHIPVDQAELSDRGLKYDRRFMVVDENGVFLSQRRLPSMALIQPQIEGEELVLSNQSGSSTRVPLVPKVKNVIEVEVFGKISYATTVSEEADNWLSEALGTKSQLVYMHDESERFISEKYNQEGKIVSFADGFPYLIIGQAALDNLNTKLETPIPMTRFRPNFVFSGGEAHDEDQWKEIKIGEISFNGVVPWGRCVVTTIDQKTAEKGKEPLKTLNTYRKFGEKIAFGMTLVSEDRGIVKLGDKIEVIK